MWLPPRRADHPSASHSSSPLLAPPRTTLMQNLAGGSRYLYEARLVQLTPADLGGPDHPLVQWANRTRPLQSGTWQLTGNRLAIHQDGLADMRFVLPAKAAAGLTRLLEPEVPFHSITLQMEELLSEHVIVTDPILLQPPVTLDRDRPVSAAQGPNLARSAKIQSTHGPVQRSLVSRLWYSLRIQTDA